MTTSVADPEVAPSPALFGVYSHQLIVEGRGSVQAIVIACETQDAKCAMERTKIVGCDQINGRLLQVRQEFFATGEGSGLSERRERLKAAENDEQQARAALAELRQQWASSVAMDGSGDVTKLEKMIEDQERKVTRFAARVPVLRNEYQQFRATLGPKLRALLMQARDEFIAAAELEVEERFAPLREAVNELFLDWLFAQAKHDGAVATTFGPSERIPE